MVLKELKDYFYNLIGYDPNVVPEEFNMDKWKEHCYSHEGKSVVVADTSGLMSIFEKINNESASGLEGTI